MDNHPIPQDVSHFQFKLIGEMTLKQFGYLGAGFAMAWLFFSLPINFFVRIPLALIYAGTGSVLAFVPIEGRPADTMIKNFVKALFAPNQYLFRKESADPVLSSLLQSSLSLPTQPATTPAPVIAEVPNQPGMELYQSEQATQILQTKQAAQLPPLQTYTPPPRQYVQVQAAPAAPQPPAAQPKQETVMTQQPVQPPVAPQPEEPLTTPPQPQPPTQEHVTKDQLELRQEADSLTQALQLAKTTEQQLRQGTPGYEQAHQKVLELEEQLQQSARQKQQLEQELLALKQKLVNQPQSPVYTPSQQQAAPATQSVASPHVRQVSKQMGSSMGMPSVPDFPNLITGIVRDSRGNVLPNTLIEVKDNEGNPVRAFKTNQLGQFASATPLLNGKYTIFFEDPQGKHRFDTIEINANGDILLPIEVISIDQREELRKELFG